MFRVEHPWEDLCGISNLLFSTLYPLGAGEACEVPSFDRETNLEVKWFDLTLVKRFRAQFFDWPSAHVIPAGGGQLQLSTRKPSENLSGSPIS